MDIFGFSADMLPKLRVLFSGYYVILKEIGHHLQNFNTRTRAHISKEFRRKIITPPPRNKGTARSEGESGASPTRNRLDAAKIGPHTVRERAQFILVPGERGFFTIRNAAKEA